MVRREHLHLGPLLHPHLSDRHQGKCRSTPLMSGGAAHAVCGAVSAWPGVRSSRVCRWVLEWVIESTNPVEYHGQSYTAGITQVLPVFATSPKDCGHDASGCKV